MNPRFEKVGFYPADILLPREGTDMTKWAVVACDQFTSQPEYWRAVEEAVGDAPSTLRLILPEAALDAPDVEDRIAAVNAAMGRYLDDGLFRELPDSLLYIERVQPGGKTRHGLIGMVDLEQYDFTPGSGALIRATEGTVLSRIPPRVQVRMNAPIELPHVMLLIDDPGKTVIEPLTRDSGEMERLYSFDLQQGGGHITGWRLTASQMDGVADALSALCTPEEQAWKYGVKDAPPMLFAVGDGNHSLAAAKQCYEDLKKAAPEGKALPARYALVEVVNHHDDALPFEPIHRCVFGVEPEAVLEALKAYYPGAREGRGKGHVIAYAHAGGRGFITVPHPRGQLAAGTLQTFLDSYVKDYGGRVDYIHGGEVADRLGSRPGSIGFKLPAIRRRQLFKTVMADGVLPRKTFSMGRPEDKRYYVEARRIR